MTSGKVKSQWPTNFNFVLHAIKKILTHKTQVITLPVVDCSSHFKLLYLREKQNLSFP